MARKIGLTALTTMKPEERRVVLDEMQKEALASRNGQTGMLNGRIRAYEIRYEMTSDEMRTRLRENSLKETAEIANWLYLLDARDNRVRT